MVKLHKPPKLITSLLLLTTISLLYISDSLNLLRLPATHAPPHPRHLQTRHRPPSPTSLKHIVFGIGSSADHWARRRPYVNLWWRRGHTRGFVFLDRPVRRRRSDPPLKVSSDTTRFGYTNKRGTRAGLRMTRIVSEMTRMRLPDVRWFVMGDDDTVFYPENLVRVLRKYDHTRMYYVGSGSETHVQNVYFSYGMAFGGGGFAISYPLAAALEKMQDRCMERYPELYGSDDRIHACLSELGVPLTREPGFHQFDIQGSPFGLLAAHPVAPLVSLHHLDLIDPIFPSATRLRSLQRLSLPAALDSAALMQHSICYDTRHNWTVSVSWGFAVQLLRGVVLPREMEKPPRTFRSWYGGEEDVAFAFNTRPLARHPCQKPYVYYMEDVRMDAAGNVTTSRYRLEKGPQPWCWWRIKNPSSVRRILIQKMRDPHLWDKAPRRNCCRVLATRRSDTMEIDVGVCRQGEVIEATTNRPSDFDHQP